MQTLSIPAPLATHTVQGGGDVKIAVQEWGNPAGRPIIFIHALMQNHLGYLPILTGPLAQEAHLIRGMAWILTKTCHRLKSFSNNRFRHQF